MSWVTDLIARAKSKETALRETIERACKALPCVLAGRNDLRLQRAPGTMTQVALFDAEMADLGIRERFTDTRIFLERCSVLHAGGVEVVKLRIGSVVTFTVLV